MRILLGAPQPRLVPPPLWRIAPIMNSTAATRSSSLNCSDESRFVFSLTRPISPICQSPFFPYLTLKFFF